MKPKLTPQSQAVIQQWEDEAENANYHGMVPAGKKMLEIMAKFASQEIASEMLEQFIEQNIFDF